MKICFFLENNKAGGLDTFVKNLLIYWPNANDKLILFSNDSHPGIKFLKIHFKNKNIKILKYQSFEKIYDKLTINQKIQRYIKNIFLFNHKINYFYKLFKKNKFDRILFIQGGYPGGQLSNAAIFAWDKFSIHKPWFNFHNFAAETRKWDFFREILNLKISNKIEGFISVSKVCLKSINKIKYFRKLRQKYIYNGVEFDNYHEHKNNDKKYFLLLMLGVYEPRKGHQFLFNSLLLLNKSYKNFKCLIYGDGSMKEFNTVKKSIPSELKNKIYLRKHILNIKNVIKKSDIILVPSQELESFGYSALEAMAFKKPIVSTNSGGLVELIENKKNGFVVNKNNVNDFSNKIVKLIKNKQLRYKMGQKGFKRYKKFFTSKEMSKKYAKLIV